jgi:CHAT domain-containing protein
MSYIQLADGQLWSDDLLQHDLSYELVTLSACETGRAKVVPGDELIGLGRSVLYAGAGALLTSLWRVDDATTFQFMDVLYARLRAGDSKAAAVQHAYESLRTRHNELHPAFWGAFQLVGHPDPLTCLASRQVWTVDEPKVNNAYTIRGV